MKDILFKSLDGSLNNFNRSIKLTNVRYNTLVIDPEMDTISKYLEEWCQKHKLKLIEIHFDEVKFFFANEFRDRQTKETILYRVRNGKTEDTEPYSTYTVKEYNELINYYEDNLLMYYLDHTLKFNDKFNNLLNNSEPSVIVIKGMEDRMTREFDNYKRRKILDLMRTYNYSNSVVFYICLIPNTIKNTDYYSLTCYDGKDQFLILKSNEKK